MIICLFNANDDNNSSNNNNDNNNPYSYYYHRLEGAAVALGQPGDAGRVVPLAALLEYYIYIYIYICIYIYI